MASIGGWGHKPLGMKENRMVVVVGTNKTLLVIVFKETRVQVLVFQLPRVFHRARDLALQYPASPQHPSVQEECLTAGV